MTVSLIACLDSDFVTLSKSVLCRQVTEMTTIGESGRMENANKTAKQGSTVPSHSGASFNSTTLQRFC